jgi:hypothetical protein
MKVLGVLEVTVPGVPEMTALGVLELLRHLGSDSNV